MDLEPIPTLLKRVRGELGDAFAPGGEMRVSRAPGRLDVMGGVTEYSGITCLGLPMACGAAICSQPRGDGQVQIFSFNQYDEHKPFTLRMPRKGLAEHDVSTLRRELAEPGRPWAGYVLGELAIVPDEDQGLNIALLSDVPFGAGLAASAAIGVTAAVNFVSGHSETRYDARSLAIAARDYGAGLVDEIAGYAEHVTVCGGTAGQLTRVRCQPVELLPPLAIPRGMKFVGIDSGTRWSGIEKYLQLRCASFMAHRVILEKMRDFGRAAGRELRGDPMEGFLANLDPDDYKKFFRQFLPEAIKGGEYLLRFGTGEWNFPVAPDTLYALRSAADHHVLEAMRVRNFVKHIEEALSMDPADPARGLVLDKAGHLMYASHLSYMNDAGLGSVECDLLVTFVRKRERSGLYGARMTAGGCGGTVAVLCEDNDKADTAIREIAAQYQNQTGKTAQIFDGTSPGAWETGIQTVAI